MDNTIIDNLKTFARFNILSFPNNPVPPDTVSLHSLLIQKFEIELDYSNKKTLTPNVFGDTYKQINCSSSDRNWNESLKLNNTPKEILRLMVEKLDTAYNLTTNVNIPFLNNNEGQVVNVEISNKPFSSEKIKSIDVGNEGVVNIIVPTLKKAFVRIQRTVENFEIPFKATILIDGKAIMKTNRRWSNGSGSYNHGANTILTNDSSRISRYLNEEQRTFYCSGSIVYGQTGNIETRFRDEDVDREIDCDFKSN